MHLRLTPQENAMTTKNFSTKTAKQCISHFLLWINCIYISRKEWGFFPALLFVLYFLFHLQIDHQFNSLYTKMIISYSMMKKTRQTQEFYSINETPSSWFASLETARTYNGFWTWKLTEFMNIDLIAVREKWEWLFSLDCRHHWVKSRSSFFLLNGFYWMERTT